MKKTWTRKSTSSHFLTVPHYSNLGNAIISLEYVDFWPKSFGYSRFEQKKAHIKLSVKARKFNSIPVSMLIKVGKIWCWRKTSTNARAFSAFSWFGRFHFVIWIFGLQWGITGNFALIRHLSGNCQPVIRQLSGNRQALTVQSSGSHKAVIRNSSGDHQAVIRESSGSYQTIIRQSSGSH